MIQNNFHLIIKKSPVASLSECLNLMTVDQLVSMSTLILKIGEYDLSSPKKSELVPLLKKCILKRFKFIFDYKAPVYKSMFHACILGKDEYNKNLTFFSKSMKENGYDEETCEYLLNEIFEFLIYNGLIFAFLPKGSKEIEYIVPADLIKKLAAEYMDDFDREDTCGSKYDFGVYAKLLTSLYGVLPAELFQEIYNRDYKKEKITDLKLFKKYMDEATQVNGGAVYLNGDLISLPVYINKTYEAIKETRADLEPYIPTQKEIYNFWNDDNFDADNENLEELFGYLIDKGIDEREALIYTNFILDFIHYTNSIKDVMGFVSEKLELSFDDIDDANVFLKIITDLNNSIHNWYRWGHIPLELQESNRTKGKTATKTTKKLTEASAKKSQKHIELSPECHVPTKAEIKKMSAEFTDYWDSDEYSLWQEDGEVQVSRIIKLFGSKYMNKLRELPEDFIEQFLDQWLASLWHKKANRGGKFGNQIWQYCAFSVEEKLDTDLYVCRDSSNDIFVIYSHSVENNYEEGKNTCLTVVIDMGGWYESYGPVLGWSGLIPEDFNYLAKNVASQMYDLQGLDGVIQFNPFPFWASFLQSEIPPVTHDGKLVIECILETKFVDDKPFDFPENWDKQSVGKLHRWIFNKDDYLGSSAVYFDERTKDVVFFSYNMKDFEKFLKEFESNFVMKNKVQYNTLTMGAICQNIQKRKSLLSQFEKKFENFE